jgi:hypothetical protein
MNCYEYTKINPNLDQLEVNIKSSEMINKSLFYIRWDVLDENKNEPNSLKIYFENELIESDKTVLDTIVSSL